MCVVSMISDHYRDKWNPVWPTTPGMPYPYNPVPTIPVVPDQTIPYPNMLPSITINGNIKTTETITRIEFDTLKADVLEMKELLKKAIKYDADNNQPHCENDEKVALLRKVAELVGVSLKDVFPDAN